MKLITEEQMEQLVKNGLEASVDYDGSYHRPVVCIKGPNGAQWLLTFVEPHDNDIAFGLCDLGMGFPELGYVRLSELEGTNHGPIAAVLGHMPVCEANTDFVADKTIMDYSSAASKAGRIVL